MTVRDWIDLINCVWPIAVGVGGVVWGWYQRRYRLPAQARFVIRELGRVGVDIKGLTEIVNAAGRLSHMTNEERRVWAVEQLQGFTRRSDIEMPDATANLIIEWLWSKAKAKK